MIEDSKARLDRLRGLVVGDPERARSQRRRAMPTIPTSDRALRAVAIGSVPLLLAVQAWRWDTVHAGFHPAMLVPIALGCLLCLATATRSACARSVRTACLPLTLLLMTAAGLGCLALFDATLALSLFERRVLGFALITLAAAATSAGVALVTASPGPATCGHRLMALGLTGGLGALPFLLLA